MRVNNLKDRYECRVSSSCLVSYRDGRSEDDIFLKCLDFGFEFIKLNSPESRRFVLKRGGKRNTEAKRIAEPAIRQARRYVKDKVKYDIVNDYSLLLDECYCLIEVRLTEISSQANQSYIEDLCNYAKLSTLASLSVNKVLLGISHRPVIA